MRPWLAYYVIVFCFIDWFHDDTNKLRVLPVIVMFQSDVPPLSLATVVYLIRQFDRVVVEFVRCVLLVFS